MASTAGKPSEYPQMKRGWFIYFIGSAVGLQFRTRAVPVQDRERPTLLLTPKELWASGFDARKNPKAISSNASALVWTPLFWTQETVDAFRNVYNEAMNPPACGDVNNFIIADNPGWGLTSRVRDFQDILIGHALHGELVLHRNGADGCPGESENRHDPFMLCIFEPFSRCQNEKSVDPTSRGIVRLTDVEEDPGQFFKPILDTLRASGLAESGHAGEQPGDNQYLGVIRSLLQTTAFTFSSRVEKRVAELEGTFGKQHGPMLIIHIRRTDKVVDGPQIPSWFDVRDDDEDASLMQSLDAIVELIKFVESYAGKPYDSLYLIADDPRFFGAEYSSALQRATARNATILYNPYVSEAFGEDRKWMKGGHDTLAPSSKNPLDVELAADLRFAIKYGSHIVGCGRSGISQFIAQGLGAKYMVDPNALTAFEDDALMLGYVMGRAKAEAHVQYMSARLGHHGARRSLEPGPARTVKSILDPRLVLP